MHSDLTLAYRSYLSRLQLARLQRVPRRPVALDEGLGAILLLDISGFSRLADRLGKDQGRGAEQLSGIISAIFGPMMDELVGYGGDPLFFAGDAVFVLFPVQDPTELGAAVGRSATAALSLLAQTGISEPLPGLRLQLRATIGVGPYVATEVGGVGGRWLLVLEGPALRHTTRADELGQPGTLTLTPDAWTAARAQLVGTPIEAGHYQVSRVLRPISPQTPTHPLVPDSLLPILRTHLAPAVTERIEAGLHSFIAEYRQITAIFIQIPVSGDAHALGGHLHTAGAIVQEQVERFGGVIHNVLIDKGSGFICAFGLPPLAHEDDPARAVAAAEAIRAALAQEGVAPRMGIATGVVYAGELGGNSRRTYEVIGVPLVMAARLMQQAGAGEILVCPTTVRSARRLAFERLPPRVLKGLPEPITPFRPVGRRHTAPPASELVGRSPEIAMALSSFQRLRERHEGGALLVVADAGMGKSTLLRLVRSLTIGLDVFDGAADALEVRTPFYAFRPVVSALFDLPTGLPSSEQRTIIVRKLAQISEELAELAPLLDAILPLGFPESPRTAQMEGSVRAENLRRLLVRVMAAHARPIVLFIEDLHWLDASSWLLCRQLCDEVPSLLLYATSRPLDVPPPEWEALRNGPGRSLTVLGPLDRAQTAAVAARRLGVASIPDDVAEVVFARAEGNPLFAEEIALSLVERGVIAAINGQCSVVGSLQQKDLPASIIGVITHRIDRLRASLQLTLKVASVIGRAFTLEALFAIHPPIDRGEPLAESLRLLTESALIVAEGESFSFRHALIHETTYGLLADAQRRPLHRAAAEFIERTAAHDLSPYFGVLAFHWGEAAEKAKAAWYAARAGEQALEGYANQAAVYYFTHALELDEQVRGPLTVDLQRARWHRLVGEAYYQSDRQGPARVHYEAAIQYAGFGRPRISPSTLWEVGRNVLYRYWPPRRLDDAEARQRGIEAVRAAIELQVVCLWAGDQGSSVHVIFQADNIGRMLRDAPETGYIRSAISYLLYVLGMRSVALRDLDEANAISTAGGSLAFKVGTYVIHGMTLVQHGSAGDGLVQLYAAERLARGLGASLWRHRSSFMLAEALLTLGRWSEAEPYFADAAAVARHVEASTAGMAQAMRAQCRFRTGGSLTDCLSLLDGPGGVSAARSGGISLRWYASIGVQMEILLAAGRTTEALALADEGLAMGSTGTETYSYLRGVDGHYGVCLVFVTLWRQQLQQPTQGLPAAAELAERSRRALKNLKRCAGFFYGVQPRYLLMAGEIALISGRPDRARKHWQAALELATRFEQSFEKQQATAALARLEAAA